MQIHLTELKVEARQAIRGRHPSAFLVSLAFYLILVLLTLLSRRLMITTMHFEEIIALSEQMAAAQTQAQQMRILESLAALSDTRERLGEYMILAIDLMETMLMMGFAKYCLDLSRGIDGTVWSLFDAFGNFFRFLGLNILISILVSLATLLLIIPGIILSYSYALAPYLLMDDPKKGPIQCMRESRERMRGHKWKLFLLDLSLLGWLLLTLIPGVAIYTVPYCYTVRANFYRAVTGRWEAPEHVDIIV